MDIYRECENLLNQEDELVRVWNRKMKQVPSIAKNVFLTIFTLVIGAALCTLCVVLWKYSGSDAAMSAKALSRIGSIVVGVFGFGLALTGLINIATTSKKAKERKEIIKSNEWQESNRKNLKLQYDNLRDKLIKECEKSSDYKGKTFFFHEYHPLDVSSGFGSGGFKLNAKENADVDTLLSGEINLRKTENGNYRLDGFHGAKCATYGEAEKIFGSMNFLCPVWDSEYMRANADKQCYIYTLQQIRIECIDQFTLKNDKSGVKTFMDTYYQHMNPVAEFIASGVSNIANKSVVKDERKAYSDNLFNEYHTSLKNVSNRIDNPEAHTSGAMFDQLTMGYIIVDTEGQKLVRGFAIPNYASKALFMYLNHDTFRGEHNGFIHYRGDIAKIGYARMNNDIKKNFLDFETVIKCALEDKSFSWPELDILQEKNHSLNWAQWACWLKVRQNQS